jgi:hypothetical protein
MRRTHDSQYVGISNTSALNLVGHHAFPLQFDLIISCSPVEADWQNCAQSDSE